MLRRYITGFLLLLQFALVYVIQQELVILDLLDIQSLSFRMVIVVMIMAGLGGGGWRYMVTWL